ncbi:MAG: YccF domain-containing protein [Gammaproteobacteria bacterium]
MRTLGNVLWHFPFLGFISAFVTFITGIILVALVITAPIGRGLVEFSKFLLAPYSRTMIKRKDMQSEKNGLWQKYEKVVAILWLPLGLILALVMAIQTGLVFLTIVSIPVAIVLAKSIGTYLNPVGKVCVDRMVAEEMQREKAKETLAQAKR